MKIRVNPCISLAAVALALSALTFAQTYRVAGTVLSATEGHPLAGVRLTLADQRSRKPEQSMLTDADGHFEFLNVPAGKYPLTAARRGYITAAYNQHENFSTAIVTGAGIDTEHLTFRLAPLAQISGLVLDEHGDPVRDARVTLWHDDHSTGLSRVSHLTSDGSDDRGYYEFSSLAPGTYFLSVHAEPWYAVHPHPDAIDVDRALDVVYPTTYYSGATESEDATPILVRGGDRLQLDLHLLPVAPLHVHFHIPPEGNFATPMLFKQIFDDADMPDGQAGQIVAPGIYEIVTAPGHYKAILPQVAESLETHEVDLDLSEDNQEVDLNAISGTDASLSLSAQTADGSPIPTPFFALFTDAKGRRTGARIEDPQDKLPKNLGSQSHAPQSLDAQPPNPRQGLIPRLHSGTYSLAAFGGNQPYAVTSITRLGANNDRSKPVPGNVLDVAPGSRLSVLLTVVAGNATVEGVVERNGKPFDGAMVVLIPARPESNLIAFRRDQSDLDGSFGLPRITPGNYTVVAIQDGWDLDWSQPAAIARYAPHGEQVTILPNTRTIHLPTPLKLQPK